MKVFVTGVGGQRWKATRSATTLIDGGCWIETSVHPEGCVEPLFERD